MAGISSTDPRIFAVVPAAGRSRRMGQPKLLLPLGHATVIGRLLRALESAHVRTFVLVRPDDDDLQEALSSSTASIVVPDRPPGEMRDSVVQLLKTIEARYAPADGDGWLLIPADHPFVSVKTLGEVIREWRRNPASIVLPSCDGRRGHPTLFPWPLAAEVHDLPPDVGINQLVRQHADRVREVVVDDSTLHFDLDTPADYERARQLIPE